MSRILKNIIESFPYVSTESKIWMRKLYFKGLAEEILDCFEDEFVPKRVADNIISFLSILDKFGIDIGPSHAKGDITLSRDDYDKILNIQPLIKNLEKVDHGSRYSRFARDVIPRIKLFIKLLDDIRNDKIKEFNFNDNDLIYISLFENEKCDSLSQKVQKAFTDCGAVMFSSQNLSKISGKYDEETFWNKLSEHLTIKQVLIIKSYVEYQVIVRS